MLKTISSSRINHCNKNSFHIWFRLIEWMNKMWWRFDNCLNPDVTTRQFTIKGILSHCLCGHIAAQIIPFRVCVFLWHERIQIVNQADVFAISSSTQYSIHSFFTFLRAKKKKKNKNTSARTTKFIRNRNKIYSLYFFLRACFLDNYMSVVRPIGPHTYTHTTWFKYKIAIWSQRAWIFSYGSVVVSIHCKHRMCYTQPAPARKHVSNWRFADHSQLPIYVWYGRISLCVEHTHTHQFALRLHQP